MGADLFPRRCKIYQSHNQRVRYCFLRLHPLSAGRAALLGCEFGPLPPPPPFLYVTHLDPVVVAPATRDPASVGVVEAGQGVGALPLVQRGRDLVVCDEARLHAKPVAASCIRNTNGFMRVLFLFVW